MKNKVYTLSNSYSLFKGEFNEKKFFLFNIEDGTIYRLNEVSYDILSFFDGNRDINMVVGMLFSLYKGDHEQIKKDFERLVQIWIDKKILIAGGEWNG